MLGTSHACSTSIGRDLHLKAKALYLKLPVGRFSRRLSSYSFGWATETVMVVNPVMPLSFNDLNKAQAWLLQRVTWL